MAFLHLSEQQSEEDSGGTLAYLLSNNYSLSIIEPLHFADLILTPKLAKYTNKTFDFRGECARGRLGQLSFAHYGRSPRGPDELSL